MRHLIDGGVIRKALFVGLTLSLIGVPAMAQDSSEYFLQLDDELMKIGSSLTDSVVSSTKTAQRGAEAPAVITVITDEEIRVLGYGSLAEALRSVPGFYDVYDLVTHNVGVRGINGGARASGSIIKLMIDGHPVDFRPSTGNFFGEELIPLALISRVEIIRGPASALYGANAFLGVVNVITKSGEQLSGTRLRLRGGAVRTNPGGGMGLVQGVTTPKFDAIVGFDFQANDRSGLALPASSPKLRDPANARLLNERSQNDWSRPMTFFGKTTAKLARGELSLMASIQSLDSSGEFLDTGPLSHGTNVSLLNQNYRARYSASPTDAVSFQLSAHYLRARPGENERFDIGEPESVMLRRTGTDGVGVNGEVQVNPVSWLSVTAGADLGLEQHTLQTFDRLWTEDVLGADGITVVRAEGTIIPGEGSGSQRVFRNIGVFGQGILRFWDAWNLTVGARVDSHNIYGLNPSLRGGLVFAPKGRAVTVKLLYGSSFKAPSAEQLYTQPMAFLDIQGNAQLKAQTAHTIELVGGYGVPDRGEVNLNLFATKVIDRVEFLQRSLFLEAQNTASEWVAGAELDGRYQLTKQFSLRLTGGLARTIQREFRSPVAAQSPVLNALFPMIQVHLLADYRLPWGGLRLSAQGSYISDRSASQSNAIISGQAYQSPAYIYTALALATPVMNWWHGYETTATLRVSNVVNSQWRDSLFGGVNVPTQGITTLLTLTQCF